jgi:hypothetical protein
MYHPETMLQLARDRREKFERDAEQHRLASDAREAARAAAHTERRERFSVRDLRWILFRPVGA